ncbi:MAG: hypothetical protein AB4058_17345 [Microcystaceae cyanobacterium]
MIQKLFGGKKETYFLEIEETNGTKAPEPSAKAPEIAAEPAKVESQPTTPVVEKATEPAKVESQPTTPVVEKAAPPAKSSKKSAKKVSKAKTEPTVAPTPPTVSTESNGQAEPKNVEFATKYLLVPTGSRRRPGPSLNKFKDMARDVKVPRF